MKTCVKCNTVKEEKEFGKSTKHSFGLQSYCKLCSRESNRRWYEANKLAKDAKSKQWMSENKEQFTKYQKEWYIDNKTTHVANCVARNKQKYHKNPEFKLLCNLRNRLNDALRGGYKKGKTVELIGMTIPALLVYLNLDCLNKYGIAYTGNENLFHIDHIRPLSSFNLCDATEIQLACNWKNLQILTVSENLTKSDGCA